MKKVVIALLVLVLLGVLGVAGFYLRLLTAAEAPGPGAGEVELEVPKGANARTVGALLEREGLVPDGTVWRFVVWKRGGLSLKAGKFKLDKALSPLELAAALEKPPLAEDEPFVVVEGWRIRDVDDALVAAGRADEGCYRKAAASKNGYTAAFSLPDGTLEGYLYPETYLLPKGRIDCRMLVQKQLDLFGQRVFTPNQAAIAGSKRSLHELVTMASMLEREEPLPTNRPLVAGILWKRIDQGWPLGVDATSRYELKEWNDRKAFLVKLRDQSDPYNSRYRKGLPPTPIGAPTSVSFQAALEPTPTEFLYYLHDKDRQLHPAKDAEEHERNRKKYDIY